MDIPTLLTTLIPMLAGPTAAVVVCCGVLAFVGYLVIHHVIPSIEKRFTESQNIIDNLLIEHRADRDIFKEAISTLTVGQNAIQSKMQDLVEDVDSLSEKVDNVSELNEKVDDVIHKLKNLDTDVSKIRSSHIVR